MYLEYLTSFRGSEAVGCGFEPPLPLLPKFKKELNYTSATPLCLHDLL